MGGGGGGEADKRVVFGGALATKLVVLCQSTF